MLVPLILGALGLIALISSNKKPAAASMSAAANDPSIAALPASFKGLAQQALATNDPNVLNTAADTLDANGFHTQAAVLRQVAASVNALNTNKSGQMPQALQTLMQQALAALTVDANGRISGPVSAQGIQLASAAAAQLNQAGFPDAAASLQDFIAKATAMLPAPTPDKVLPLPGLDPTLAAQVNTALQTVRDPAILRQLILVLKGQPQSPQTQQAIDTLSALADQLDATIAAAQAMQQIQNQVVPPKPGQPAVNQVNQPNTTPAVIPIAVTPSPTPPPAPSPSNVVIPPAPTPGPLPAAKSKQQILAESVASGLKRLQDAAGGNVKSVQGKEDKSSVMRFQTQEGLTSDGKVGPGTNAALAKYVGVLPLVMYWPTASNAQTVYTYRAKLQTLADAADAAGNSQMATDLRASAAAERGQGGIVGSMPA